MRRSLVLSLSLRPSPILLIVGGSAHVLAVVAVAASALTGWLKGGWIVAILLGVSHFLWRYGYRAGGGFIARLELAEERWRLETGSGARYMAVCVSGYAHPWLILLNFRLENGRRRSLALLPDAADPAALRRLRVWLRTRPSPEATPDF